MLNTVLMMQEFETMAAEKDILFVFFEEFSEPKEVNTNTCLILQYTLCYRHCRPEEKIPMERRYLWKL